MQIDVSLDVYKELTNRLAYEGQSYSDVLRELMGMDSPVEPEIEAPRNRLSIFSESQLKELQKTFGATGFHSRSLHLPSGTQLRARYKGRLYVAAIEGDEWVGEDHIIRSSPSAAANAITDTTVNGLRFWEALRPGDSAWRRLDKLV